MRRANPVTIHRQISRMTLEEEQVFWAALDEFLEAFVHDHVERMRRDAAPTENGPLQIVNSAELPDSKCG